MATLGSYTHTDTGTAYDVLTGFDPGLYDVTIQVSPGSGIQLGDAAVGSAGAYVLANPTASGAAAEITITTTPGELFALAFVVGRTFNVLAVPRVE